MNYCGAKIAKCSAGSAVQEVELSGFDRPVGAALTMIMTGKKWQDLVMFLILLWIELTVAAASDGKQAA